MSNSSTQADPRGGAPSASYYHRIDACPPSFELSKHFEDPETRDSKSGDLVHKALERWGEHGATDGLEHDQIQTAEMCIDQRNEALDNWIGEDQYQAFVERRLGLTILGKAIEIETVDGKVVDATTKRPVKIVTSGMADYSAISEDGKSGFVADYKTLRGEHDEASENAQLRGLAVLLWKRHNLDRVRVVLIQPWKGRPTTADFDLEALKAAEAWVYDLLERERNSTPDQTKTGKHCRYCPAKVSCKMFTKPVLATVERATESITIGDDKTTRAALFARAAQLSDEELAARFRGLDMVKWYAAAIDGAVRLRAEESGAFARDHFKIVETKPKETVSKVGVAWNNLAKLGVTPEAFAEGVKTSKKHVSLLVRKATGLKGAGLAEAIKKVLDGACSLGKPAKKIVPANQVITDSDDDGEDDGEE